MQPKMGGKLHLKLNIGTRPIANKYREGKMKSTLKRELKVRETVKREAHGISNALSRFRRTVRVRRVRFADLNGLLASVFLSAGESHAFGMCVSIGSERMKSPVGR